MHNQWNVNIIADTHTHTLACSHAYSTISENASTAAAKGLRFLATTEHCPAVPGSPDWMFFMNFDVLPRALSGVTLLRGAEVNVTNTSGGLDLSDRNLEKLEWVIASMHTPVFEPAGIKEHTSAWLAIAENPLVDVIGHVGDGRYPFDEKEVLKAFKKHGKIVEINAHSFNVRPGSAENCPRIAKMCAEMCIPVVVNSDAHFHASVGDFDKALKMLESLDFPEELIINADYDRFVAVLTEKGINLTA